MGRIPTRTLLSGGHFLRRVPSLAVPALQDGVAVRPLHGARVGHRPVVGHGHRLRREPHLRPGDEILPLARRRLSAHDAHSTQQFTLLRAIVFQLFQICLCRLQRVHAGFLPAVGGSADDGHARLAPLAVFVLVLLDLPDDQLIDDLRRQGKVVVQLQQDLGVSRGQPLAHGHLHLAEQVGEGGGLVAQLLVQVVGGVGGSLLPFGDGLVELRLRDTTG